MIKFFLNVWIQKNFLIFLAIHVYILYIITVSKVSRLDFYYWKKIFFNPRNKSWNQIFDKKPVFPFCKKNDHQLFFNFASIKNYFSEARAARLPANEPSREVNYDVRAGFVRPGIIILPASVIYPLDPIFCACFLPKKRALFSPCT